MKFLADMGIAMRIVEWLRVRLRNTRTPYVLKRIEHVLEESSNSLKRGAVVIVEDVRHRIRELPIKGK
jgi:hypothetical protein